MEAYKRRADKGAKGKALSYGKAVRKACQVAGYISEFLNSDVLSQKTDSLNADCFIPVIGVIKRIKGKTCPESKEDALARVRYGFRAGLLFCFLSTEICINGGGCRLPCFHGIHNGAVYGQIPGGTADQGMRACADGNNYCVGLKDKLNTVNCTFKI